MLIQDKLIYARAKLNLSQEALARELNVSFATINRWEKGRTIPSKRYIILFDEFCRERNLVIPNEQRED